MSGISLGLADQRYKRTSSIDGLVGDGVTDNRTLINNAIAALSASGGGTLTLPDGIFNVSGSIRMYSNIRIVGQGIGRTVLRLSSSATTTSNLIINNDTVNGSSYLYFADITLSGNLTNRAGATGSTVVLTCSSLTGYQKNIIFERVEILDSAFAAVQIYSPDGCVFHDCWIDGAVRDGLTFWDRPKNVKVNLCTIQNTGDDCIACNPSRKSYTPGRGENFIITGNYLKQSATSVLGTCMRLSGLFHGSVENNKCLFSYGTSVVVDNGTYVGGDGSLALTISQSTSVGGTGQSPNGTVSETQILTLSGATQFSAQAPTAITNPGSGYIVGELITLAGGTFTTAAVMRVDAVNGSGNITACSVNSAGMYSVNPVSPVAQGSSNGSGTGATFTFDTAGGAWFVEFWGDYSGPIMADYANALTTANATASQVQDALRLHPELTGTDADGAPFVTVSGSVGGPYSCVFSKYLGNIPAMVARPWASSTGVKIIGNTFMNGGSAGSGNAGATIRANSKGCVFNGNTVEGYYASGLSLTSSWPVTVTGNYFGPGQNYNSSAAISVKSSGNTITGNTFERCPYNGIVVDGWDFNSISGNVFNNLGQWLPASTCIRINSGSRRNVIYGNTFNRTNLGSWGFKFETSSTTCDNVAFMNHGTGFTDGNLNRDDTVLTAAGLLPGNIIDGRLFIQLTANGSINVPAGYLLEDICFTNTTANAVTIKIGTTLTGTEVYTSAVVGANADLVIPAGSLTTRAYQSGSVRVIYFSSTNWNSSNVIITAGVTKMRQI